jgi:hypothetical protein
MQVELRPHRGINLATKREQDLNQDKIYVEGQHVGYVGRKPNAPINLIERGLGPEIQMAIRDAVQAKYGGQAERISEPVEVPDDYLTGEDQDEDQDEED